MSASPVCFSVFLPVRNGGSYLKLCVRSILDQTYPNFELHILDNASTDDAVPWLSSLKDPRVHIWQSPRALSIEDSWARILNVPKRDYMTFLGHDDLFDPQYLERARTLIERYPDASLYETGSRLINAAGETIRSCQPVAERETAAQYLEARLTYRRDALGTGFVMRSGDYDRLGGMPPFERLLFADDALWLSLAKLSWKAADPRESLSIRIHERSESASMPSTWRSILLGLDQFTDFMERFIEEDEPCQNVYRSVGPSFLARYHRNIYIYALMEACQKGERIDPAILRQIESLLARKTSGAVKALPGSFPVKALEALNRSRFRSQVDRLWKIYYRIRTHSA